MSYASRKDRIDREKTAEAYDRWHEKLDDEKTIEADTARPGMLISELFDSEEVARQISGETSTAGR